MKLRMVLLLTCVAALLRAEPEYPKMGPDIYDPKADGKAQISAALATAAAEHKNVLLMFGANWCVWCHRLHTTFATNAEIARVLRANYEVVLIDINTRKGEARNAQVDARYGNPTKHGLPVLVVLDAAGNQLTTQDTGALEDGKNAHDPQKILAFLEKWRPASR
jgi:thiol:disulfide interchange protein